MATQGIKVQVNAGSVPGDLAQFQAALTNLQQTINAASLANVEFNKTGKSAIVTLQQIGSQGETITATLTKNRNSFRLLNLEIQAHADKLNEARKAYDNIQKAAALSSGNTKASNLFTNILGIDTSQSSEKIKQQAAEAQRAVARAFAQPGVNQADFIQVFHDLQQNIVKAETGVRGKLQDALKDVLKVQRDITAEADKLKEKNDKAAAAIQNQNQKAQDKYLRQQSAVATNDELKKLFPTPPTANLKQLADYEAKLKGISELVAKGKISEGEVVDIGKAVAAGKTLDNLSAEGVKVQKSLTDLKGSFVEVGKDGKKSIDIVGAAFSRLEGIIVRAGVRQAFFGVVESIKQGVKDSVEIDLAIGKLQVSTEGAAISFNKLSSEIRKLSDETGFKQIDLANAGVELFTQRATNANDAFKLLRTSVSLSTATLSSTDEAATALSKTLNSYKLSNDQATQASAVLYRTSQLTGSKVQDIGASFVQTSQAAKALGIDLETTAGFIATLGQNGFTASESATLLDSILGKLLKPTKELEEVFKKLGVGTGEQLISRFGGLSGALKALLESSGGDATKLEELVGGLKQLKAFLAATGDGLQDLEKNTNDVANSIGAFTKAAAASTENAGARIRKEFENISNFFSKDLGANLVRSFDIVSHGTVNLSTGVRYLTYTVGVLAGAWTALKLVTLAANAALLIFSPTAHAAALAQQNLTAQTRAYGSALLYVKSTLLGVVSVLGIAGIAITGILALASVTGANAIGTPSEEVQRSIDITRDAQVQVARLAEQEAANRKRIDDKAFDDRVSNLQKYISAATVLGNAAVQALQNQERQVSEILKVNSDLVLEDYKSKLSDLKRDASQAKSELESSKRAQASFGGKLDDKFFDRALKFDQDPFAALGLIKQRRQVILREIAQLEGQADKASIEATRRKFDTLEKLNEDSLAKTAEITKKRAEFEASQGRLGPNTTDAITGKPILQVPIDVTAANKEELRIVAQRAAYEENIRKLLLEQEAITRRKIIIQTIAEKGTENAIKKLTEFSIFDSKGAIEKRFRGATPEEGINKAVDEFDRQQEKVRKLLGEDAFKQLDEFASLQEKRKAIHSQAELAIKLDAFKNRAEDLANFRKNVEDKIALLEKQKQANADSVDKAVKDIEGQIASIKAVSQRSVAQLPSIGLGGIGRGNLLPGSDIATLGKTIDLQFEVKKKALEAEAALQELNKDRGNEEKIQKLRDAVTLLVEAFDKLGVSAEKIGVSLNEVTPAEGAKGAVTIIEKVQELQASLNSLSGISKSGQDISTKIRDQNESLKTAKDKIQEAENELSKYASLSEQANKRVKDSFLDANQGIDTLTNSIVELAKQIEKLSKVKINVPAIPGIQNVGDFTKGGEADHFASGGPVFAPSGTDIIPAMLSPGEYVWDPDTTRKFYPLISGIHANNARPMLKASGGSVTTIGDINLNITGGGTSEQTAREIVYRIRRELRRGAISDVQN